MVYFENKENSGKIVASQWVEESLSMEAGVSLSAAWMTSTAKFLGHRDNDCDSVLRISTVV